MTARVVEGLRTMTHHIVIIEPDGDTNDAICELLSECGAPLHRARNVDAALSWINSGGLPCALVVSCGPHEVDDVNRLVGFLRRRAPTVDVPLFVLTTLSALQPFDDRTRVLQKPFDSDRLHSMVRAATARCR